MGGPKGVSGGSAEGLKGVSRGSVESEVDAVQNHARSDQGEDPEGRWAVRRGFKGGPKGV
jgi:hypothetical protein